MSSDVTRVMEEGAPTKAPFAIISDIHSNLDALRTVLDDIRKRNIKRIVCLGDIVGYGPDPAACWRLVSEHCEIIIRGNHDQALSLRETARFHPRARKAIEWTRSALLAEPDGEHIVAAITNLPRTATSGDFLFVHGSPYGPTMDYLLPGDSFDRQRMAREFDQVDRYAFNGHTHIPGVIAKGTRFMPPEALTDERYPLADRQAIANVGSVGQPRDGNPKACYVTVADGAVQYHRLRYDAEAVCRRILEIKDLDPFLGQRLLAGY